MYAYKGFLLDLTCEERKSSDWKTSDILQYEIGEKYELPSNSELVILSFKDINELMNRFPPSMSRYAKVIVEDIVEESNTIISSKSITVEEELNINDLINILSEKIKNEKIKKGNTKIFKSKFRSCKTHCKRKIAKISENSLVQDDVSTIMSINEDKYALSTNNDGTAITTGIGGTAISEGFSGTAVSLDSFSKSISTKNAISTQANSYSIATGFESVAVSLGECSESYTSNKSSPSITTGEESVAITKINNSPSISTGDISNSKTYGPYSAAITTGYESISEINHLGSVSITTGDKSIAIANSIGSIAAAFGEDSEVKGKLGSFLILVEWNFFDDQFIKQITDVKVVKVDGVTIKEDTSYMLIDGEIVEREMHMGDDEENIDFDLSDYCPNILPVKLEECNED